MAYIRLYCGKWRAQIQIVGSPRESKVFKTEREASEWASSREALLKRRSGRVKAGTDSFLLSMMPLRLLEAIEKIDYTHDEITESPIPVSMISGVYFLIKKRRVVYVGQSVDVFRRISKHAAADRDFDSFNYLACDPSRLDEVERAYIEALMPDWNETMGGQRKQQKDSGKQEPNPPHHRTTHDHRHATSRYRRSVQESRR